MTVSSKNIYDQQNWLQPSGMIKCMLARILRVSLSFRQLSWPRCTMGRMTIKPTHEILGHRLVYLLIHLLHTARFVHVLSCAYALARLLTPKPTGTKVFRWVSHGLRGGCTGFCREGPPSGGGSIFLFFCTRRP